MKGRNALVILGILCLASILASQTQINSNTSNLQLFPKVAYTDGGNYLFTWVSNHSDTAFEIYSRHADNSLTPQGSDRLLSPPKSGDTAKGHRLHAEIIPSVKGSDKGAIIAWVNHYDEEVYAKRITSTGGFDPEWPTAMDELIVHDASFMTPPEMCSDGAGGAYFTWVEEDGDDYDLNVKRITSSGGNGFSAQTIATSSSEIFLPRICLANSDTAKIAWVESKIFDKILINDINVSAVLKEYKKHQFNPFVGFLGGRHDANHLFNNTSVRVAEPDAYLRRTGRPGDRRSNLRW